MTDSELLTMIQSRIARAQSRYGGLSSTHEALGVASEEWDELRDAIRANDLDAVSRECIDLAAVLIRLASAIVNKEPILINRSVK